MGGTYYPEGWYSWDGVKWVSDRNAIANAINQIILKDDLSDYNNLSGNPFLRENDVVRLKGDKCDTGLKGDKGDTGNQGIQGVKGDTGAPGIFPLTEIEIDFGIDPVSSKTFLIVDASVLATSKILSFTSPNPATGRIGNDWELDMPFMSASALAGIISLTISFNHLVVGKRKIYYQIIN